MAKTTKVTGMPGAAKAMKKKARVLPKKAQAPDKVVKGKKSLGKVDLGGMFRAAVESNESFRIDENDDYGIAVEHFTGVIRRLDAIIAIEPSYRDAINYKGVMLVGCGNNKEAVECFDAVLKLNPADKEALNNKGIALYGLGREEEALECVDGAIALDSRYPDAYMNKAVILHAMGRIEEADKAVRRARMLDVITG